MKTKELERIEINYDLLRIITPQGIQLKNNRVQMGEIYSRCFYIRDFPSNVNLSWLSSLKDIPNTTVSILVTPIEDVQAYVNGISKGMTTDRNVFNTSQNEALRTRAKFKIESAENIIKDITVNNIPYVKISIVLKVSGDTEARDGLVIAAWSSACSA